MGQHDKYDTLKDIVKYDTAPMGYKTTWVHSVYDIKHYGNYNLRLVAD